MQHHCQVIASHQHKLEYLPKLVFQNSEIAFQITRSRRLSSSELSHPHAMNIGIIEREREREKTGHRQEGDKNWGNYPCFGKVSKKSD